MFMFVYVYLCQKEQRQKKKRTDEKQKRRTKINNDVYSKSVKKTKIRYQQTEDILHFYKV